MQEQELDISGLICLRCLITSLATDGIGLFNRDTSLLIIFCNILTVDLSQVSLLDTPLFLSSGLPRVLTSSLLELSSMPRLAEAVIASLLRLYTSPQLR